MTASPRRRVLAVLPLALALACSRPARTLPEVKVHVASDLPAEVLADVAARFGVAKVVPVAAAADAELAWVGDPAQALALGERLVAGSAPAAEDVPARWRDPKRRFAPLGARARVLLVSPAARLPFSPSNLRDLADPRARGRISVVPFGRGAGPVTIAALVLAYGGESAGRFLSLVARNEPQLADADAEVRARVASGQATFGLAGSLEGAAAAASATPLEVVYPDQLGSGAVALPTAVALLGGASDAARALAAWLAGPDAERVLVARIPGLLPLRAEVPVPVGVEPAGNIVSLPFDWDALAAETGKQRARLERWPEGFTERK
ncbi:ABC transporter substrate-binding protein [Anaeromyxobacter sp. Fw109-5]|uniref:ABC transporter substrate-binding protein n=1 Tax=Anaeromyxobacter sp. (strain Fw109-5) TaxID=404589 RepID=UPI000158A63A|nr:ABC transporter substrate-binding protein [Anaeromyxobacter sp. Fw109-5]ABS24528.1 ABC-type Fe3+ transporter, periplasmic ligand binding protein [Anaeromyxobacter sp. Fw109-5]